MKVAAVLGPLLCLPTAAGFLLAGRLGRVAGSLQGPPVIRAATLETPSAPKPSLPEGQVLTKKSSAPGGGISSATYFEIKLPTKDGISIHDITPAIRQAISDCKVKEGFVTVVSRHTTTAVMLNEYESRLVDDVRQYLLKLAPPDYPYLHNDLHLRPATEEDRRRIGPDWPSVEEWRAQEPKNCHSHLLSMLLGTTLQLPVTSEQLSMLLGTTLQLPVTSGQLAIGRWQSALMVELDGPRERTVGVQVVGF